MANSWVYPHDRKTGTEFNAFTLSTYKSLFIMMLKNGDYIKKYAYNFGQMKELSGKTANIYNGFVDPKSAKQ